MSSTGHARGQSVTLTRRQLYQRVWLKPLSTVAKDVGLSSNALAKICDRLLVPYPSRGYWAKRNAAESSKPSGRPSLPAAPEAQAREITISPVRAASRRVRTRLTRSARHEQLLDIARQLIREHGLHVASMKRIAAVAGISETQAYNYFGSREKLLADLAHREFVQIRAVWQADSDRATDHYSQIVLSTRAYLRQIGERGGLLQMLVSNPDVRAMLRKEHRKQQSTDVRAHAAELVESYGVPWQLALGCTVVLTTLCLRAGKVIADGRISPDAAERLCLSIVLNGSRNIVNADRDTVR
jgi:AcrR family transcriptional regulator